jgi:hypothetical protein
VVVHAYNPRYLRGGGRRTSVWVELMQKTRLKSKPMIEHLSTKPEVLNSTPTPTPKNKQSQTTLKPLLSTYWYVYSIGKQWFWYWIILSVLLGRVLAPGGGEVAGKGVGGWILHKKGVHVHVDAKTIPVETVPEIGGGGIKDKRWRDWIQV